MGTLQILKSDRDYYKGNNYGAYQFTSLNDIINQFLIAYVGEDKIISKVKRTDVQFHAMRALQELSFDTFKSCKAQEITVPASLQMILPQDYINYTKISWVDSAGIKHLLYPTSKTSNPRRLQANDDGEFIFSQSNTFPTGNLIKGGDFYENMIGNWHINLSGHEWLTQQVTQVTTGVNSGNPDIGWYIFNNGTVENSIRGYKLREGSAFVQKNLPILQGEEYKITYTISDYTSGSFRVGIVDERGDYTTTTSKSANGTYEETITAGDTAADLKTHYSAYFESSDATANGNYTISDISIYRVGDSIQDTSASWANYKSATPSENQDDYQDDTYWPANGERYGLDPQHAQTNGSYYIDCVSGKIHFSSNLSGKTVVLDYLSDSLGTDAELQVHKLAEEAMYKWMAYAILSTRDNVQEYIVQRFKKEKFAETRKSKLRLSNIKLEEITQILRCKSKQIKH